MRVPQRLSLLVIGWMILSFAACGQFLGWPTPIQEILNTPSQFAGQAVLVEGRVLQSFDLQGEPAYDLQDGTGVVPVFYSGTPPVANTVVAVQARVVHIDPPVDNRSVALRNPELLPSIDRQMNIFMGVGIALVGWLAIPAVLSVAMFRSSMTSEGPDSAQQTARIWTWLGWFVLAILVTLFILRQYSALPIYLLLGYAGMLILIALFLLAVTPRG